MAALDEYILLVLFVLLLKIVHNHLKLFLNLDWSITAVYLLM